MSVGSPTSLQMPKWRAAKHWSPKCCTVRGVVRRMLLTPGLAELLRVYGDALTSGVLWLAPPGRRRPRGCGSAPAAPHYSAIGGLWHPVWGPTGASSDVPSSLTRSGPRSRGKRRTIGHGCSRAFAGKIWSSPGLVSHTDCLATTLGLQTTTCVIQPGTPGNTAKMGMPHAIDECRLGPPDLMRRLPRKARARRGTSAAWREESQRPRGYLKVWGVCSCKLVRHSVGPCGR